MAKHGPNPYEIVVISDHGQSQGATFKQRYGATLEDVARGLMAGSVSSAAHAERVEEWGPINAMLAEFTSKGGVGSAMARRGLRGHWSVEDEAESGDQRNAGVAAGRPDLLVVASGNLAMLYLPRHPGRLSLEQLTELHPDLVPGLTQHPGIGFVVVETDCARPGRHRATQDCAYCGSGQSRGEDPLAPYGEQTSADLLEHSAATTWGTSSCAACSKRAPMKWPPSKNWWAATAAPAAPRPAPCCFIPQRGRRRTQS